MTRKGWFGPKLRRIARLTTVLVALGGIGAFAARGLSIESAQARSLVEQGRAALDQGQRAQAVLSFERARLLAPRADFVRAALSRANVREIETGATHAVTQLAPREWSFLLVAFGWVVGLSVAVAISGKQGSRTARRLALGAGFLFAFSAAGVVQSAVTTSSLRVVSSATGVLVAPYQGAGATADLTPGVVVAAGPRYGDFIQVCGPNGTRGWVTASALEPVLGV